MGLIDFAVRRTLQREPDFIIGPDRAEGPYMERWYVWPRNKVCNLYLHRFLRSDEDFALHDHPWLFNVSRIYRGRYCEHTVAAGGVHTKVIRREGDWKLRFWKAPHRVELLPDEYMLGDKLMPCWTLFLTGPVVREWGFHCPSGWISFKEKIRRSEHSSSGRLPCP